MTCILNFFMMSIFQYQNLILNISVCFGFFSDLNTQYTVFGTKYQQKKTKLPTIEFKFAYLCILYESYKNHLLFIVRNSITITYVQGCANRGWVHGV